jgi:hypothetical protein
MTATGSSTANLPAPRMSQELDAFAHAAPSVIERLLASRLVGFGPADNDPDVGEALTWAANLVFEAGGKYRDEDLLRVAKALHELVALEVTVDPFKDTYDS